MPFSRPPACGNKARQEEKVGKGEGGEGEEKGGLGGRERQMKEGKGGGDKRKGERGSREA